LVVVYPEGIWFNGALRTKFRGVHLERGAFWIGPGNANPLEWGSNVQSLVERSRTHPELWVKRLGPETILIVSPAYGAWHIRPSIEHGVWGELWVFIPLWLPLAFTAVPTTFAWRTHILRRRRHLHLCPSCRYDLRGLPPGTPCPECGETHSITAAAPAATNLS
jgi:hypothetical protein